MYEVNVYK